MALFCPISSKCFVGDQAECLSCSLTPFLPLWCSAAQNAHRCRRTWPVGTVPFSKAQHTTNVLWRAVLIVSSHAPNDSGQAQGFPLASYQVILRGWTMRCVLLSWAAAFWESNKAKWWGHTCDSRLMHCLTPSRHEFAYGLKISFWKMAFAKPEISETYKHTVHKHQSLYWCRKLLKGPKFKSDLATQQIFVQNWLLGRFLSNKGNSFYSQSNKIARPIGQFHKLRRYLRQVIGDILQSKGWFRKKMPHAISWEITGSKTKWKSSVSSVRNTLFLVKHHSKTRPCAAFQFTNSLPPQSFVPHVLLLFHVFSSCSTCSPFAPRVLLLLHVFSSAHLQWESCFAQARMNNWTWMYLLRLAV